MKKLYNDYKELTIDNRKLLYRITFTDNGWPDEGHYETIFYDSEPKIREERKYVFFGPKHDVEYYEYMFTLNFSIDSEHYTKLELRNIIKREVDLLSRKEQIINGDII